MKFNSCRLEIEFKFGSCRNDYFKLQIDNGKTVKDIDYLNPYYSSLIELPTKIKIITSGKNHRIHTIVKDGDIIEDMYVQVTKIKFDGLEVNNTFYHKKLKIITIDNDEHITNYFGFNGTCTIDLNHDNMFTQFLSLNTDQEYLELERKRVHNNQESDGGMGTNLKWEKNEDPWLDMAQ